MRIVRPVVFEALLIGLAGAVLAVATTSLVFETLREQVPSFVYGNAPIGVDWRVTAIGLAMGLLGAVLFAAVPAWRTLRLDTQAIIQNRHRRGAGGVRAGRPMIVIQVGLATVLVFGAVISARALVSVLSLPLGFDPENVVTVALVAPKTAGDAQPFFANAIQELRRRPDVVAAGAAGSIPFDNSAYDEGVRLPGSDSMAAGIAHVLPGFFETASIPLLRGRLPTFDDLTGQPEATVLSASAARVLFADRDPLGQSFDNGRGRLCRVIGIVPDVRKSIGDRQDAPAAYAFPGAVGRRLTLLIKTRSRQESTLADLKRTLASMAPGATLNATWWSDRVAATTAIRNPRFQTMVLTSFAAIALGLMTVGVFAVIAFSVASRTREMGVRVAIGARPASLIGLMIRQALMPAVLGLFGGLVATRWLAGFAASQLYQVDTNDPATLAGAAALVLAAAVAAAYLPARRASRVDPIIVLRAE
jgi:predicted permease